MYKGVFACFMALSVVAGAGLIGSLSTSDGGLVSGGKTWASGQEGLTVSWIITENPDSSWHYKYEFTNAEGLALLKQVNHFIFSISDHFDGSSVYNLSAGIEESETGTFGAGPSNPGFPSNPVIGLKISLYEEQLTAEFDSLGVPMWLDFYAKGGANPKNFAYNKDFGTQAVNTKDYTQMPVDAAGNPLSKILAPNLLPETATWVILAGGVLMMNKRKS